jgi:hypothetical protein
MTVLISDMTAKRGEETIRRCVQHHTLCKLGEVGEGRVIVGYFLMTKEGQGNNRVTDLCKVHVRVDCSTAVGPANTWYLQKLMGLFLQNRV